MSSCPGSRNLEGLLDEYTFDHVQDMVHLSRLLVDDPAANPMKFVQFSSSSGTGRHALGVSVSTKDDAETTVITDPDEQAELLTTPLSVFDETSGKLIMAGKRSANFWNEALHRLSFTSTSQDLAVTGSAKRGNCTALVVQSMPLLLNKEPQTTLTTAKQFIVTYKLTISFVCVLLFVFGKTLVNVQLRNTISGEAFSNMVQVDFSAFAMLHQPSGLATINSSEPEWLPSANISVHDDSSTDRIWCSSSVAASSKDPNAGAHNNKRANLICLCYLPFIYCLHFTRSRWNLSGILCVCLKNKVVSRIFWMGMCYFTLCLTGRPANHRYTPSDRWMLAL